MIYFKDYSLTGCCPEIFAFVNTYMLLPLKIFCSGIQFDVKAEKFNDYSKHFCNIIGKYNIFSHNFYERRFF